MLDKSREYFPSMSSSPLKVYNVRNVQVFMLTRDEHKE